MKAQFEIVNSLPYQHEINQLPDLVAYGMVMRLLHIYVTKKKGPGKKRIKDSIYKCRGGNGQDYLKFTVLAKVFLSKGCPLSFRVKEELIGDGQMVDQQSSL